jgi:hypothetical protein
MKLTAKEVQAIRDMRAMDEASALAWRKMGGMLAGRLQECDSDREEKAGSEVEYVRAKLVVDQEISIPYSIYLS